MEKLSSEVTSQQKVSVKAQSDCHCFKETLRSSRDELKRLERQATSVIMHFRSCLSMTVLSRCFVTVDLERL